MSESTLRRESAPEPEDTDVVVGATGQELREHREALGLSLMDISDTLCIRRDFLEALESGRYDALPGEAYAMGFVRSYAKHLGLDADALARRFKVELTGERPTARLDFLTPAAESRVPTAAIVLVAVLLAIGIYGLWYFVNAREDAVSDIVPEPPARLAQTAAPTEPAGSAPAASPAPATAEAGTAPADGAPQDAPTGQAAADAQPPMTPSQPAAPAAGTATAPEAIPPSVTSSPETVQKKPDEPPAAAPEPAASQADPASAAASQADAAQAAAPEASAESVEPAAPIAALPPPVPPARRREVDAQPGESGERSAQQTASAAPTISEETARPQQPPPVPAETRIVLRAKSESWVEVRSNSGKLLISRVLSQGETYPVPPQPGLELTTGNAGGLEILVDGQALPPLGAHGAVRRGIALDPDRLKGTLARSR